MSALKIFETEARNLPRKVLMTADNLGGVWAFALDLILELANSKIEVVLVIMGDSLSREQRDQLEGIRNLHFVHRECRLEWMRPNPWKELERNGPWLLELEAEFEPDLIHLNEFAYGSLAWIAPKLLVAHWDGIPWWRNLRREGNPTTPEWAEYRRRVGESLRRVDCVVVPSRASLDALCISFGLNHLVRAVAIPSGRLRENWEGAAVFAPSDGSRQWEQQRLNELIPNPAEVQQWARRARERSLRFASEAMASSFLHLYRQLTIPGFEIADPRNQEEGACAS